MVKTTIHSSSGLRSLSSSSSTLVAVLHKRRQFSLLMIGLACMVIMISLLRIPPDNVLQGILLLQQQQEPQGQQQQQQQQQQEAVSNAADKTSSHAAKEGKDKSITDNLASKTTTTNNNEIDLHGDHTRDLSTETSDFSSLLRRNHAQAKKSPATNVTASTTSTSTTTKRQDDNQEKQSSQNLKIAIYMTTHFSQQHVDFLLQCWPTAIQKLRLVQQADLLVYTSATTKVLDAALGKRQLPSNHEDEIPTADDKLVITKFLRDQVGFTSRNITVYHHVYRKGIGHNLSKRKQDGAVLAMIDPFLPGAHWFDGYDWIVRLNPDVLIRRDDWLMEQFLNSDKDAILTRASPTKHLLYTDFFAFRPTAVHAVAWQTKYQNQISHKQQQVHAESHLWGGFASVVRQGRVAWLPNVVRQGPVARTTGPHCDVIHDHDMLKQCPNYI